MDEKIHLCVEGCVCIHLLIKFECLVFKGLSILESELLLPTSMMFTILYELRETTL